MKTVFRILLISVVVLPGAWLRARAAEFTAVSLNAAESAVQAGGPAADEARRFGNITHLSGLIFDTNTHDVIIVGEALPDYPAVSLDDFVVALRGVYQHSTPPLVSIDPRADTSTSHQLRVRFEGGIQDSAFGRDALACDVLLKKIALGQISVDVWGGHSYFDLLKEEAERTGRESHVSSRFWFRSRKPTVACADDTYVVLELPVGVDTEVLGADVCGVSVTNLQQFHDQVGDAFAHQMELNLENMAVEFPVLKRARQLLALVSLAEGVKLLDDPPNLDYWLNQYAPEGVTTETSFDLLRATARAPGGNLQVNLSGGFDLTPYLVRLKKGHPSAFKEVVLKSRPSPRCLTWHPSLPGWEVPGVESIETTTFSTNAESPGFSLDAAVSVPRASVEPFSNWKNPGADLPQSLTAGFHPTFHNFDAPPREFANIGGVALIGRADTTDNVVGTDMGDGGFALVTGGGEAKLSPEQFRKFVTALWAVNYSDTDPGISIDPVAPGVKEHLVRYIGDVINSDLGRVMRICDYTMKQWAVGSVRPDLPGFMNPDDIAGRKGVAYTGVGSRFWFVPKDLTFRRSGGTLIFDHGRMTVQTEFLLNNPQGMKADPANEEWAAWFTTNYPKISVKYPFFSELFDYAKLVALAKYLKESGTPLLGFLMANKDLVLTEDSPGTVEALVKNSDHFEGLRIEGGVQLVSPPQYVLDDQALAALRDSAARSPALDLSGGANSDAGKPSSMPATSTSQPSYSIVPEQSLTCGRDPRGGRYQTDVATRIDGRPGLELVRWFGKGENGAGDFGRGWQLLIPYRIQPDGEATTDFLNVRLPTQMILQHQLGGKTECLVFSTNHCEVAGWFPANLADTDVVGLFPLSDGSFQLDDKMGNHFAFDPARHLTAMALGGKYQMDIEYSAEPMKVLRPDALQIRAGREQRSFGDAVVPEALTLANRATGQRETYLFCSTNDVAGYVPADPSNGAGYIGLLSDGSFRLEDRVGNQFVFDGEGHLQAAQFKSDRPLVCAVTCGKQRAEFEYGVCANGQVYVSKVLLKGAQRSEEIDYQQDADGRLCAVRKSPLEAASARNTVSAQDSSSGFGERQNAQAH